MMRDVGDGVQGVVLDRAPHHVVVEVGAGFSPEVGGVHREDVLHERLVGAVIGDVAEGDEGQVEPVEEDEQAAGERQRSETLPPGTIGNEAEDMAAILPYKYLRA